MGEVESLYWIFTSDRRGTSGWTLIYRSISSRRFRSPVLITHQIAPCVLEIEDLSVIRINLEHGVSGKGRDGSRDVGGRRERHNSNHGKTSVVQFTVLLFLQCGGINRGKIDRREDDGRKGTSLGVVDSIGLGDDFGKEDQTDNLLLACTRYQKTEL